MSNGWATDMGLDQADGDPWAGPTPPAAPRTRPTAYLDIETATCGEILWSGLVEAGLARELDRSEWLLDPAARAWVLEHAADRATDPFGGRVVCWALATSDDHDWVRSGADERELLAALEELLATVDPTRIVAHYGHGFDFPFVRARALALGVPELARRMWQAKPWDGNLVDTTDRSWSPTSTGWKCSLDNLAELFGLARPPQLKGAEVPAAWYAGRREEVEAHCLDDVRTLRMVTRRLAEGRGA